MQWSALSSSSWTVYHQQIISLKAQKKFIIFFHDSWGGVIGIKASIIVAYVKIMLFFVKKKKKIDPNITGKQTKWSCDSTWNIRIIEHDG